MQNYQSRVWIKVNDQHLSYLQGRVKMNFFFWPHTYGEKWFTQLWHISKWKRQLLGQLALQTWVHEILSTELKSNQIYVQSIFIMTNGVNFLKMLQEHMVRVFQTNQCNE